MQYSTGTEPTTLNEPPTQRYGKKCTRMEPEGRGRTQEAENQGCCKSMTYQAICRINLLYMRIPRQLNSRAAVMVVVAAAPQHDEYVMTEDSHSERALSSNSTRALEYPVGGNFLQA